MLLGRAPCGTVLRVRVDIAIVGAGGAGLSLVLALDRAFAGRDDRPSVALFDPVRRAANDRTWCWWAIGPTPLEQLLTRSWPRMALIDARGEEASYRLSPARYVMLRSADLYAAAGSAIQRLGVVRVEEELTDLETIDARWVFDSRPARPRRPGGTFLLQHFRGWFIRFDRPMLDENLATLMDFELPQPRSGVAFCYCLPLAADRALVEYTEFSPARLESPEYDQALRRYLQKRWPGMGFTVEETEDGAIPMTDAPFARRQGRVVRIGTAGGATRPSTGYTFAAIQRQVTDIARAAVAGRPPLPRPAYPARHRWMDAVLLRALDTGAVDGPQLLTDLFRHNPTMRVIRFLDGASSPAEDLAVMRSTPALAMARSALADAGSRAGRRARSVLGVDSG